MGSGPILCFLGFSTFSSSEFAHRLEQQQGRQMSTAYRTAYNSFLEALDVLHDAVDAAADSSPDRCRAAVRRGLAGIDEANRDVTEIVRALGDTRRLLAERAETRPDDVLVARESIFASLPYEALSRELDQAATLGDRRSWNRLVARLRSDGTQGGLRVLEGTVRRLQSAVHELRTEVERRTALPARELAAALHDMTLEGAVVQSAFHTFLTTATQLSFVCSRATEFYERLEETPMTA